MFCYQITSPSASITSENVSEIHSIIRSGWIPGGKSQMYQAIRVFHCNDLDGRQSKRGRNSMRLGQAKDCTTQQYLETSSKYGILVQFEARSRERLAIISNTITCSRSLQHTACNLVHHQPLQDLPVDKRRHQEPLWRENLQSGGNQRKTFSAIVNNARSKVEARRASAMLCKVTTPTRTVQAVSELVRISKERS